MTTASVSPLSVSVSRASPIRFYADGSAVPSFPLTGSWKQPFSTADGIKR